MSGFSDVVVGCSVVLICVSGAGEPADGAVLVVFNAGPFWVVEVVTSFGVAPTAGGSEETDIVAVGIRSFTTNLAAL